MPSFENETENFVKVVVVQRGDRVALENGAVLAALTAKINKANAPKSANKQAVEDPKANLDAVAKQYGLTPDDLDKAIRTWGSKTTDPYDVGLAALYARNYDAATTSLQDSLKKREDKLTADKKADEKAVADAAFFLGQSLYEQGRYRESAAAYQRCLQIRPDDAVVLNNTALSMAEAGDYAAAEPLFERALAIRERAFVPYEPEVATSLNNLAGLLYLKSEYARGELLYRRALAIDEKAFGPAHPEVAADLNNLALLLREKGDYAGSELLFQRSLAIYEKALGPDRSQVAGVLTNLGGLLITREITPRLSRSSGEPFPLTKKPWGQITPMLLPNSITWPTCCRQKAATLQPNHSYDDRWRSTKKCWGRIILTWQRLSIISACYFWKNVTTVHPSRCSGERWKSTKKRWEKIILAWPHSLVTWAWCYL